MPRAQHSGLSFRTSSITASRKSRIFCMFLQLLQGGQTLPMMPLRMLIDWQKARSSLIDCAAPLSVLTGMLLHHLAVFPELLKASDQVEAVAGFARGEAGWRSAGGHGRSRNRLRSAAGSGSCCTERIRATAAGPQSVWRFWRGRPSCTRLVSGHMLPAI